MSNKVALLGFGSHKLTDEAPAQVLPPLEWPKTDLQLSGILKNFEKSVRKENGVSCKRKIHACLLDIEDPPIFRDRSNAVQSRLQFLLIKYNG